MLAEIATNKEYCPHSGKECFNTKWDAERALKSMNRKMKGGSVYRCEYCGKWHTTSCSYRKSKAVHTFWKKQNKGL